MKNINLMNIPLLMGTLLRKVCLFLRKSLFKKNINPTSGARVTGGWSLLLLVGLLFGGVGDAFGQCTGSVLNLNAINVQDSSATIVWDPIVGTAPISYQVTIQEDLALPRFGLSLEY